MKHLLAILSALTITAHAQPTLANSDDIAAAKDRANHTGTQALSTITGLGTAATVNTGTTSGTIPLLTTGGKLPAVDGSLLTGIVASSFSLSGADLVVEGDSKSTDTAPSAGAGNTWPAIFMSLPIGSGGTLHNYATTGQTMSGVLTDYATQGYTKRPAVTGKTAYFSLRAGSNDLSSNMATFWTNLSAHYATLRADGFKIIAWTITPRQNQTPAVNAEINRINNLIRSSSHLWDYLVEAEAALPDPTNTTYYSDGLHETAAGNRVHAYVVAAALSGSGVPSANLGSLAYQAAAAVAITGGTINGTPIGATTKAQGDFTGISATAIANLAGGFTVAGTATGYIGGTLGVNSTITAASTVQGSKLKSTGGVVTAITTTAKTTNYNIAAASDSTVICDATSASFTVFLPVAAGNTGQTFTIKKTDSTANTITLNSYVGDLFDGAATKVISTQYSGVTVQSDNNNWQIIATF